MAAPARPDNLQTLPVGNVPFIRLQGFDSASDRVKDFIHFTEGEADLVYGKINTVSNLLDWILYLLRQYVGLGLSKQEFDNLKKYVRMKLAHIGTQINGQTRNKLQAILNILERPDITSPEVLAQALQTPPFNTYSPRAEVPTTRPQVDGATQLLLRNGASPPAVPRVDPKLITPPAPPAPPILKASPAPPAPPPPAPKPLSITYTPIDNFKEGIPITPVVFSVTGGTGPYTWSATNLPDGLEFTNGVLSGTPSTPGTGSFTIQVSDPSGSANTVVNYTVEQRIIDYTEPVSIRAGVNVGGLFTPINTTSNYHLNFKALNIKIDGAKGEVVLDVGCDNPVFKDIGYGRLWRERVKSHPGDCTFTLSKVPFNDKLQQLGVSRADVLKVTSVKLMKLASVNPLDREGFSPGDTVIEIGLDKRQPVIINTKGISSYVGRDGTLHQLSPATSATQILGFFKTALIGNSSTPKLGGKMQIKKRQTKRQRQKQKTRKIRR